MLTNRHAIAIYKTAKMANSKPVLFFTNALCPEGILCTVSVLLNSPENCQLCLVFIVLYWTGICGPGPDSVFLFQETLFPKQAGWSIGSHTNISWILNQAQDDMVLIQNDVVMIRQALYTSA